MVKRIGQKPCTCRPQKHSTYRIYIYPSPPGCCYMHCGLLWPVVFGLLLQDKCNPLYVHMYASCIPPGPFPSPMQAAAVSVCQFLASEVHKPVHSTPEEEEEEEEPSPESKAPKKKLTVKRAMTADPVAAVLSRSVSAPQRAQPPTIPPPSPVVTQIMEMGFPRRHVEYAMQVIKEVIRDDYKNIIVKRSSYFPSL